MTRPRAAQIFSRKRSYWLRCFLGSCIILLALSASASATSCTHGKISVTHVRGHVGNQLLENLPGAKITMKKSGQTVAETVADQNGDFRLKVPRGEYDMIIEAPGWHPSSTHLTVGFGFRSLFHDRPIRVFLTVSALCASESLETQRTSYRIQC